MGLFWDLMQQSQISTQRERTATVEMRLTQVENNLHRTRTLLHDLIVRLETKLGEDLDRDGHVG